MVDKVFFFLLSVKLTNMKRVEKHLYRLKKNLFSCQTFVLRLFRIPVLSSNTSPAYSLNIV